MNTTRQVDESTPVHLDPRLDTAKDNLDEVEARLRTTMRAFDEWLSEGARDARVYIPVTKDDMGRLLGVMTLALRALTNERLAIQGGATEERKIESHCTFTKCATDAMQWCKGAVDGIIETDFAD